MPYVKNKSYSIIPFSTESSPNDFYKYYNIKDLLTPAIELGEEMSRCRVIGILKSDFGRYYISDVAPSMIDLDRVRVSMKYLKKPPPSTILPYPVQIFGNIQWNKMVIYANILQPMNVVMALRLRETITKVVCHHLAESNESYEDEKEYEEDIDGT